MWSGHGPTASLSAGVWRWPGFLQKAALGPTGLNGRTVTGAQVPVVSEPQDDNGKGQRLELGWGPESWRGCHCGIPKRTLC